MNYFKELPANAKAIKNTLNWCTPDGKIYGQETRKVPNRWHKDMFTPVKHYGEYFECSFSLAQGYKYCALKYLDKNGKYIKKSRRWHIVIAETFIPNPENKTCVNHIDNNRTNNRVDNLEWVTPKENVYHSFVKGRRKVLKGVQRTTVLTDFQVSQIAKLRTLYTVNQLSKLFNIKYSTLKNIIRRVNKRRLDNQQPSIYKDIYEGSTTIPQGVRLK